jgi:hypothetical protein
MNFIVHHTCDVKNAAPRVEPQMVAIRGDSDRNVQVRVVRTDMGTSDHLPGPFTHLLQEHSSPPRGGRAGTVDHQVHNRVWRSESLPRPDTLGQASRAKVSGSCNQRWRYEHRHIPRDDLNMKPEELPTRRSPGFQCP